MAPYGYRTPTQIRVDINAITQETCLVCLFITHTLWETLAETFSAARLAAAIHPDTALPMRAFAFLSHCKEITRIQ